MKTITGIALLAASTLMAGLVGTAQAQGDNTIRAGVYLVHYDANAADISGTGAGAVPPGVNMSVNDVNTLYLAYVRRLSADFDLEVAAGIPPKTNTTGKGPSTLGSVPYSGQVVSTSRWFAPTFLVNYKFFDESSAFRPYAGIGFNYTHFFDNTVTPAGNAAFGGPTTLALTNSVGGAATIGASYRLQDRWSLYGSYSKTRVKSDMTANTSGVIRKTTIDFWPSAFVISAGYSF